MYLKGETELNLNSSDKSTPVNVRIYQLTDDTAFEAADFDLLWEDDEGVLADSLVDMTEHVVTITHDETEVLLVTEKEVLFIGVVGLFNQQSETWKQCVPVDDVEDWRFSFIEFHIEKTER